MSAQEVFLIRHGETEWSLNGRHTGISDIPLTENGRQVARQWRPYADTKTFDLVLVSPLKRAQETCRLAGLAERAQIGLDLHVCAEPRELASLPCALQRAAQHQGKSSRRCVRLPESRDRSAVIS